MKVVRSIGTQSPTNMNTFSKYQLPGNPEEWPKYAKKAITSAIRINGEFLVETSEGTLRCADGYLAMDARGYPYPIATEEFELIYESVDSSKS